MEDIDMRCVRRVTICLLFALILVSCVVPITHAAKKVDMDSDGSEQYTVLVLDISGSMSGTPLSYAKRAATLFCQQLFINDDEDLHVAIVSFDSVGYVVCGFTNDLTRLTSAINSLYEGGSTSQHSALSTAESLFSGIQDTDAKRNIVLMSDGIPCAGATSASGRYSSSDSYYYQYANAAYNLAKTLWRRDRIYSLGFFHSLNGSDLSFGRRFMRDLANAGYYEVQNPEDLEFEFGMIADQIAGKLSMSLSASKGGKAISPVIYNSGYFWPSANSNSTKLWFNITVKDLGKKSVKETLTLPAGLSFSEKTVVSTKKVKLKGNGKASVTYSYPVFSYFHKQSVSSLRIKARDKADHYLALDVKTLTPKVTMTVSAKKEGATLNPIYAIDNCFCNSADGDSEELWLNVNVENVAGPEISASISLPGGLSFAKNKANISAREIFGGKGKATQKKSYRLYVRELKTDVPESIEFKSTVSFGSALPDINGSLTLNVKDLSGLEMSLWTDCNKKGTKVKGYEIKSLDYGDGNLLVSDTGEDDVFYLSVSMEHAKKSKSVTITLPAGLSFSSERYTQEDRKKQIELGGNSKAARSTILPVYSVYKKQAEDHIKISGKVGKKAKEISLDVNILSPKILHNPDTNISNATAPYKETAKVNWGSVYGNAAPKGYDQSLADLGVKLSFSIYGDSDRHIEESLHNLGFSNIKYVKTLGIGNVDGSHCCLATKTITGDTGTISKLVILVVRGTIGWREWVGNFMVGLGETPDSFGTSASRVTKEFDKYMKDNKLSSSNASVYVCGHSRGAAVANLVAHTLISRKQYRGVTGYTFATPNTTKNASTSDNIYNFKYFNDLVGYTPVGFVNHGNTYVIGMTDSIPDKVRNIYKSHTGRDYEPVNQDNIIAPYLRYGFFATTALDIAGTYGNPVMIVLRRAIIELLGTVQYNNVKTGRFANNAHSGENYISWITARGTLGTKKYSDAVDYFLKKAGVTDPIKVKSDKISTNETVEYIIDLKAAILAQKSAIQIVSVACPVDVNLCTMDGTVVAEVKDHVVQRYDEDTVFAISDGKIDFFIFPADMGYYLDVTGNGDGMMTVAVSSVDQALETKDTAVFEDIPVTVSETFTVKPEWSDLIDVVEPSGDAEIQKLLRMLGNLLPGHFGMEYAPQISEGLSKFLTYHTDALFLSVSNRMGVEICRTENSRVVEEVARSYSTSSDTVVHKEAFANDDIFHMAVGDTQVYIMPYDANYIAYIIGFGDFTTFDLGMGLFNKDGTLLDTAAITSAPLAKGEMLALWENGSLTGSLTGVYLYDRKNTAYQPDRWNTEPNVELPSGLTEIEAELFAGNESMTGFVEIPEGVKSIGSRAFAGTNISFLSLPTTLEYIAEDAFDGMLPQPILLIYENTYAERWLDNRDINYMYRK